MYSVPPGFSKLRLPLGDSVIYPTARPSIRTLVRQIDYQVYSVQTYLFPNNNLRAIPPGDRHWAVAIGEAFLVIVPRCPLLSKYMQGQRMTHLTY
jgi:hypothetical protein